MKKLIVVAWETRVTAIACVSPASGEVRPADAVRWALARIRERPVYEQLRARAREIEALKSQF